MMIMTEKKGFYALLDHKLNVSFNKEGRKIFMLDVQLERK